MDILICWIIYIYIYIHVYIYIYIYMYIYVVTYALIQVDCFLQRGHPSMELV